ncbi:DHHC palmitoyltransferase-domain-containing protein [Mycena crocata]|nr:DHHC palmitoyltransferase-domain-containing protein [Mycena crocata]
MAGRNGASTEGKVLLDKPTICGTISEARYTARERREARSQKPQPWAVRKLMVVVTLAIMGYTAYVYAGRFAVRLINGGRQGEGIGLLVPWSFFYLWMLWAYVKVIFTPPGNACDYSPKTPQPLLPRAQFDAMRAEDARRRALLPMRTPADNAALADIEAGRIGGPAYEEQPVDIAEPPSAHIPGTTLPLPSIINGRANGDAATSAPPPHRKPSTKRAARQEEEEEEDSDDETDADGRRQREADDPRFRIPRGRFPPTTAVLLPPHRWCSRCAIVKPFRAHHCRICGTCVLKFDHHCPWIGQCVGARNHKFFLNFSFATLVFTLYTFVTLVVFNTPKNTNDGRDVDPQEVVIIALAALFALFTASLAVMHARMIVLSQTTVESLTKQRMKERERNGLSDAGVHWWEFGAKRRALAAYDKEWGAPDTEGNLWWAGSARAGWEDVMGRSVWGWIFPIGRPLGDGLSYRPNPRFDPDGRWRRRVEWPEELR